MSGSKSGSTGNKPSSQSQKTTKRVRLVCTFQAEGKSTDAELLEFFNSKPDGRLPKTLLLEAGHVYWTPLKLLALKEAGQISESQFRRHGLLAIAQQEAWLNYCRSLLALDPTPQVIHHQAIYMTSNGIDSTPDIEHNSHSQAAQETLAPTTESQSSQSPESNPFLGRRSQILGSILDQIDNTDEDD